MRSGRFRTGPSERLQDFTESVSFDWRLYQQDIRGSIAHARALKAAGLLTENEFAAIERGLLEIRGEIERGEFPWRQDLEDVHMNIEAALTQRIGEAGAKLHTARSRNDQVALDLRMWVRDAIHKTLDAIRALQIGLVNFGARNPEAVMPGYTHLQRAQPVLLAHHLLAYVEMLERDAGRLRDSLRRLDEMPLGSGALAGSTIVLDREAIARELGFSSVTKNSLDAVSDRDFAVEALAALALLGVHLSRLGEDVVLWCSSEFGFLRLDDAHTTGSSLMPQKKNPDLAELTRGRAGRLIGNLMRLLVVLKGLPLAYNRDLQEDKEAVFDSFDTARSALEVLAEMFEAAHWNAEKAAAAAADPSLLATDLADELVRRGVPFRKAHDMVGRLASEAEKLRVSLDAVPENIRQDCLPELSGAEFRQVFDLAKAMSARKAVGAPSPEGVRARLKYWENKLQSPEQ